MRTVYLVACVAKKREHPAAARDLYLSPLFQKARRYIELQRPDAWYVLSAKYGLVAPETGLAPYDETLNTMAAPQRATWAARVLAALDAVVAPGDEVVFIAGRRYREHLAPVLERRGIRVRVPMAGLGIGEQLQWLDSAVMPVRYTR